jgi:hypothetical protein
MEIVDIRTGNIKIWQPDKPGIKDDFNITVRKGV